MTLAVDVIAQTIRREKRGAGAVAEAIVESLTRAGYVVLPKEPTEAMTDHEDYVSGNWSRRNWEAILRSAGVSA